MFFVVNLNPANCISIVVLVKSYLEPPGDHPIRFITLRFQFPNLNFKA